ncbi:MAG: hypothetical protein U0234_00710 [Sandaracinus sp.]
MDEELPNATLRTMGIVLVAIFDIGRDGIAAVVERLRPLVEPPEGLRVTSPNGAFYSGLLVVERNVVVAGIVIEVGRTLSQQPEVRREPIVTPPSRYDDRGRFEARDEREGRLPGWAEDPRDLFTEDEPWRRR